MRVISGSSRGKVLKTPEGTKTRPTSDRVKEALFSIIQFDLPSATVLDLFGGSGTTMIAAEQLGRNAYLMELDPRYVDVIVNRWENLTGEKAVLLNAAEAVEEPMKT